MLLRKRLNCNVHRCLDRLGILPASSTGLLLNGLALSLPQLPVRRLLHLKEENRKERTKTVLLQRYDITVFSNPGKYFRIFYILFLKVQQKPAQARQRRSGNAEIDKQLRAAGVPSNCLAYFRGLLKDGKTIDEIKGMVEATISDDEDDEEDGEDGDEESDEFFDDPPGHDGYDD